MNKYIYTKFIRNVFKREAEKLTSNKMKEFTI